MARYLILADTGRERYVVNAPLFPIDVDPIDGETSVAESLFGTLTPEQKEYFRQYNRGDLSAVQLAQQIGSGGLPYFKAEVDSETFRLIQKVNVSEFTLRETKFDSEQMIISKLALVYETSPELMIRIPSIEIEGTSERSWIQLGDFSWTTFEYYIVVPEDIRSYRNFYTIIVGYNPNITIFDAQMNLYKQLQETFDERLEVRRSDLDEFWESHMTPRLMKFFSEKYTDRQRNSNLLAAVGEYASSYRSYNSLDEFVLSPEQELEWNRLLPEVEKRWDVVVREILQKEDLERINDFLLEVSETLKLKIGDPSKLKISSIADLKSKYTDWTRKIDGQKERNTKLIQKLNDVQQKLQNIEISRDFPTIEVSQLLLNRRDLFARPTYHGRVTTVDDMLLIFDGMNLSEDVPFVQLNLGEKQYIKIHQFENDPKDYEKVIMNKLDRLVKPDTFYFIVWIWIDEHDREEKPGSSQKGVYFLGTYSLNEKKSRSGKSHRENLLSIPKIITRSDPNIGSNNPEMLNCDSDTDIKDRLQRFFPRNLDIGELKLEKVSGEFHIFPEDKYFSGSARYEQSYHFIEFLDLMTLDPVFYSYLYMDELKSPYPDRSEIIINFGSNFEKPEADGDQMAKKSIKRSPVRISLHLEIGKDTLTSIQGFRVQTNQSYLKIVIKRADSLKLVKQFRDIFQIIFRKYLKEKREIELYYNRFVLPPIQIDCEDFACETIIPEPELEIERGDNPWNLIKGIKNLKKYFPDIFVEGAARHTCQGVKQPAAINMNLKEAWERLTFEFKGKIYNRQVLVFPPPHIPRNGSTSPESRVYLVSDSDEEPFIGVKLNMHEANKDKYKYLPCCYKKDHMSPDSNSYYNEYYHQKARKQKKSNYVKMTNKTTGKGRSSTLQPSIEKLLNGFNGQEAQLYRHGISDAKDSLLHCIAFAIDQEYNSIETEEGRDAYIQNKRREISEKIHPELLKQELYDHTPEEIRRKISDPDVFFDPSELYRAAEEFFDVNIVVFTAAKLLVETKEGTGSIEIPRSKLFHARVERNSQFDFNRPRETILIFKNYGSESEMLPYPQCELIVEASGEGVNLIRTYFGPESGVFDLVFRAMACVNENLTWTIERDNSFSLYRNLFIRLNFAHLFHYTASEQLIDNYGKLRGFIFPTQNGRASVIFPPSQPENLPTSREQVRGLVEDIVNIFKEPTGVTRNGNRVNGLWYSLFDIKFAIYFPVVETDVYPDLPEGPPNPFFFEAGIGEAERTGHLIRMAGIIQQIVKWIFNAAKKENPTITPELFVARYFKNLANPSIDTAGYYQDRFPKMLPFLITDQEKAFREIVARDFRDFQEEIPRTSLLRQQLETLFETLKKDFNYGGLIGDNYSLDDLFTNLYQPFQIQKMYTVDQILRFFGSLGTGLIDTEGKIVLTNTSLHDKMVIRVSDFYKESKGLPPDLPSSLSGFFRKESDFRQQPNVVIFLNDKDMRSWIASMIRQDPDRIDVKLKLTSNQSKITTPYIYRDNQRYCIIQNVKNGTFQRAISVALKWKRLRINPGYEPEELVTDFANIPYSIFEISNSSDLILSETNIRFGELEILRVYETNPATGVRTEIYAAILSLT